ncbi:MAG TPA: ATPase [Cytophagales bacterium]|nr:ATPase [Cytophagales bacterium]HAA19119.1 ATPase [Cytophagales bacterium]HAP62722.1 ATPase [Cytophagales bacterium]
MKLAAVRKKVAEKLNTFLYGSRDLAFRILYWVRIINSLIAIGLLTYGYGFELDQAALQKVFVWLDVNFLVFGLQYLARLLYAFRREEFLRGNRFEGVLVLLIILNGITNYLGGISLLERIFPAFGLSNYTEFYQGTITLFMVVVIGYDLIKASSVLAQVSFKPATTFILSFIILILVGTGLLMLPTMTVKEGSMPFYDALFTSVSASCVTGLIVVDTATYFTTRGHFIIMLLIQLGGLGIVSFATFFATFLRQGVGIRQQVLLQDLISSESLFSTKGLLRQIVFITFLIEAFAFIFIFLTWGDEIVFDSVRQKVFYSIFHSISAFCNAGFSLFSNSLHSPVVAGSYILHLIIALSVVAGGLGFSNLDELFSPAKLRARMESPWKDWKVSTKIAVFTSIILLVFGTVSIYLLERNNTLEGQNFVEGMISAFFQSSNARTAGFNSISIPDLRTPTCIILIFLMFVGASSGSVGGGIKTSTFYLIIASVYATLRGRLKIEIGKRYIPKELLFKALSIFFFAATLNLIGIFLLTLFEPGIDLLRLAFEQVSAFGTVGFSMGITPELSGPGRAVIIFSMFVGRVGTLTFALALSNRASSQRHKYPSAQIMVG